MSSFFTISKWESNFSCDEQGNASFSPVYVCCNSASQITIYYVHLHM